MPGRACQCSPGTPQLQQRLRRHRRQQPLRHCTHRPVPERRSARTTPAPAPAARIGPTQCAGGSCAATATNRTTAAPAATFAGRREVPERHCACTVAGQICAAALGVVRARAATARCYRQLPRQTCVNSACTATTAGTGGTTAGHDGLGWARRHDRQPARRAPAAARRARAAARRHGGGSGGTGGGTAGTTGAGGARTCAIDAAAGRDGRRRHLATSKRATASMIKQGGRTGYWSPYNNTADPQNQTPTKPAPAMADKIAVTPRGHVRRERVRVVGDGTGQLRRIRGEVPPEHAEHHVEGGRRVRRQRVGRDHVPCEDRRRPDHAAGVRRDPDEGDAADHGGWHRRPCRRSTSTTTAASWRPSRRPPCSSSSCRSAR